MGASEARPGAFWTRLSRSDRQALWTMGRRVEVPPGGMLCHQGVASPAVFVLFPAGARTSGRILAKEFVGNGEGDESVIELFGAGDLVAGLAPWGHPQRGTVAALDHLAALRVDRRQFGGLLAASPQLAAAAMDAFARQETYSGRRHAVRVADHPQRLAHHLLELAHRFGELAPPPDPRRDDALRAIEVPSRLSQADLANWAGVSRETLVRWYRRWRAKGILTPRPLTLLDPEALRREAAPWGDEWPAVPRQEESAPEPDAERPAGLARRTPVPIGASAGPPRRLPPDKPFFTGRTVSLGKLDLLLAQASWPRAVLVQGMAGVGKTTLAVHWAHRVAGRFPDGVIFTELRGGTRGQATPAEAMGQVLRGVGVPGDQLPRTEAELAAQCRSLLADRRLLLILDNATGAEQVRPLLDAVNAGLVLVTAQRRMPDLVAEDGRIDGDIRVLELREMSPDEAADLVAGVLGPGDARPREERRAVEWLARECGFLPLALAVAAGALAENPDVPIAETVRTLADRSGASYPAPMRPTFDLAYRGLRRDHRAAFRMLGLAAGPDVTPAALAALLDGTTDAAAEALEGMRQAFLVHETGPGRYRIHDLLRDFARERGLAEDADTDRFAAQRRLLASCLSAARSAARVLDNRRRPTLDDPHPPPEDGHTARSPEARAQALAWFESERRTLVAAVHLAARLGLHRTCWELADALFGFQEFRRYSEDNIAVHQAGLGAARAEENWAAAAVMLHNLAVAHFDLGRAVQAIGYGEDARRAFRSADPANRYGEAVALATLADIHAAQGRYLTAIEHAQRSLAIHRDLDDQGGVGRGHETLARAHLALADYETALRHARLALEIRQGIGDRRGIAETLLTTALVHRRRGVVDDAVANALESLFLREEDGDRYGSAQALTELARMYATLGLRDLARRDAERALGIYRELGVRHGQARALTTLGRLACDAAKFAEAFTFCGQALRMHRDTGDRHGEAETLAQLGVVCWRLGRYREAREQLGRALDVRREIGDQHGEAHDLENLSVVMRRLHRYQEAFVHGLEALELWHRLGARGNMAGTLGSLARTYIKLGLPDEAEGAARQALSIRREIGDSYGMGIGLDTFAATLRAGGRPEEALKVQAEALRVLGEVGDRHSEGAALVHLAAIHLELGRAEDALETGRRGLDLAVELGDTREQARVLHHMGHACQLLGRHAEASGHLRGEIAIRRDMGDHLGRRRALERLGTSLSALGDQAGAADCTRRIRAIDQWLDSEGPEPV
ncbi:tetratricopeptide repeat protein [Actinomadura rupiterrae]|uniref:tetratricopeptide repeat protein n=1 Tax=Actinomadura rupiterrae TaxID=559627 RepID=UPI0020A2BFD5|nr:tetratricopeptide repeat protein [Actinomadura rupiterrae]MCP2341187.1 tetratricopeptide (TPR) repeat protein/CRP-like cAMP-binding protein [Actinomadura rupiterrae]